MLIASLICENISGFAFLCSREKFSAQTKRPPFRGNCKMLRKKIQKSDFFKEDAKTDYVKKPNIILFWNKWGGAGIWGIRKKK